MKHKKSHSEHKTEDKKSDEESHGEDHSEHKDHHHKRHKVISNVKRSEEGSSNKMFIASLIILVVGIGLVFYGLSLVEKAGKTPTETTTTGNVAKDDVFIFLTSEGCDEVCEEAMPLAKDAAEGLGLEFMEVEYFQPVPFPGYFTLEDGKMSALQGIQDQAEFATVMCEAGAEKVCNQLDSLKEESAKQAAEAAKAELEATKVSCETTEKYETVEFESWVVSRCPFGVQTLNGLVDVARLLEEEDNIKIVPRYLVSEGADGTLTAMHGEAEHIENVRHVCLREEQPDVFWDYIECYVETGKTTECEEVGNVDSDKLTDCFENRGNDYMKTELERQKEVGNPSGSPTNMINGEKINEFDFGGRSSYGLKSTICCSLEGAPEACDAELSTAQPPRGFGVIDDASATPAEELNCG